MKSEKGKSANLKWSDIFKKGHFEMKDVNASSLISYYFIIPLF